MKLTDYIKTYDSVISPYVCEKIIEEYELRSKYTEDHDTDLYKFHQLNLTQMPDLRDLSEIVANTLVPLFEDYFKSLGVRQFVDVDTFEDIRIKKYLKNSDDRFDTHVDIMDKDASSRFCIAIIYLNDNDGLTTFPQLGIGCMPKAGNVVIFPPTWMFPHRGKTPTTDDKYIMMTSLHYK